MAKPPQNNQKGSKSDGVTDLTPRIKERKLRQDVIQAFRQFAPAYEDAMKISEATGDIFFSRLGGIMKGYRYECEPGKGPTLFAIEYANGTFSKHYFMLETAIRPTDLEIARFKRDLTEAAKSDPKVAAYLREHPELKMRITDG